MSSICAQLGEGPFILSIAQSMGMEPYLVTAELYRLLNIANEERTGNYQARLKESINQFEGAKSALRRLITDNVWKHARWDRKSKIFYNLQCELCTLDEAIADYLRSLPPAFRASIDTPTLCEEEVREANVAYHELMELAASITG